MSLCIVIECDGNHGEKFSILLLVSFSEQVEKWWKPSAGIISKVISKWIYREMIFLQFFFFFFFASHSSFARSTQSDSHRIFRAQKSFVSRRKYSRVIWIQFVWNWRDSFFGREIYIFIRPPYILAVYGNYRTITSSSSEQRQATAHSSKRYCEETGDVNTHIHTFHWQG